MPKEYFVYLMANYKNTFIYTGITNDLIRRVHEHRSGEGSAFTRRYKITKLVYFESGFDVNAAIAGEKQIKAGSRQKKIDLINRLNPNWDDLYDEYMR